jgi:hypothetical protein
MVELTKVDEDKKAWYPVSINRLESHLAKLIEQGHGYTHVYHLKKDLAYNLQYLEFQDRIIQDIKLSSVLYTQSVKTIVLIGSSILESLLHFILIKSGNYSTTDWEKKATFKGNQKNLDGEKVRTDTEIYRRLPTPQRKHMSFDAMIKCASSKKLFGTSKVMYKKLEDIRKLRNRIHLQQNDELASTDWISFGSSNINDIYIVIYSILTSSLFTPNTDTKKYFQYLQNRY